MIPKNVLQSGTKEWQDCIYSSQIMVYSNIVPNIVALLTTLNALHYKKYASIIKSKKADAKSTPC